MNYSAIVGATRTKIRVISFTSVAFRFTFAAIPLIANVLRAFATVVTAFTKPVRAFALVSLSTK